MQRITKSTLAKLDMSKETRERDIVDAEVRGFGVRIRPGADPSFYFRYQSPKTKKIRRLSIGLIRDVELDRAREIARSYRADLAAGNDPEDTREKASASMTVAELYERFMRDHVEKRNKPRTIEKTKYFWGRFVLPAWGARTVASITKGDALTLIGDVPGQVVPNRVRASLHKAFEFAEAHDMRQNGSNPFRHVPRYKEQLRDAEYLPEQLRRLWAALERFNKRAHPVVVLAKLMLLTGARPDELIKAELKNVDRAKGILVLPDSKTGKAEIELTPEAIEVIDSAMRPAKCQYVVPGYSPGQPLKHPWGAWRKVREAAGLPGMRLYDLRHVFGSYAHLSGATQRQIMDMLRHTSYVTSQRYVHGFKALRRAGAVKTAGSIMHFIEDETAQLDRSTAPSDRSRRTLQ